MADKFIRVRSEEDIEKAIQYFKALGGVEAEGIMDEDFSSVTRVCLNDCDNIIWTSGLSDRYYKSSEEIFPKQENPLSSLPDIWVEVMSSDEATETVELLNQVGYKVIDYVNYSQRYVTNIIHTKVKYTQE